MSLEAGPGAGPGSAFLFTSAGAGGELAGSGLMSGGGSLAACAANKSSTCATPKAATTIRRVFFIMSAVTSSDSAVGKLEAHG